MTLLPQLERELLAAHTRQGRRPRQRFVARLIGAGGVVFATARGRGRCSCDLRPWHSHPVSTGGGAPSPPPQATGRLLPSNPTSRQRREERYLYNALTAASRQDHACSLVSSALTQRATVSQGSPSQALLSILDVLRRSARATRSPPSADHLPPVQTQSGRQRAPVERGLRSLYTPCSLDTGPVTTSSPLPTPTRDTRSLTLLRRTARRGGARTRPRPDRPARRHAQARAAVRRPASLRDGARGRRLPRGARQHRQRRRCGGGYTVTDIERVTRSPAADRPGSASSTASSPTGSKPSRCATPHNRSRSP